MKQEYTLDDISKMIDHSLLQPTMSDEELIRGCALAVDYNCASVCIKPYFVGTAAKLLRETGVNTGTVAGFPHGNSAVETKVFEIRRAVEEGAVEVDVVVNVGKVRSGEWSYVHDEIAAANQAAVDGGAILKVIFENDFLYDSQIEQLCLICNRIRPAFIKTSTGYGFTKRDNGFYNYDGARFEHLALMRRVAVPEIQIKAAGGIRTLDDLLTVRKLGVTRVGATATAAILDEAVKRIYGDQAE